MIDTYLPCCALARSGVKCVLPLSRYRFLPCDAPQVANLPDLGNVIRQSMICAKSHKNTAKTLLEQIMVSLFKAQNRNPRTYNNMQPDTASLSVLLNLLLALLLGLYPHAQRKPTWDARVNIWRRVHCLLTSSPDQQWGFVCNNWIIIQVAVCEYICQISQLYMPVETGYIEPWLQVTSKNSQAVTNRTDNFRHDHIDDGNESWEQWSAALAPICDIVVRGLRVNPETRIKKRKHSSSDFSDANAGSNVSKLLDEFRITVYPIHARVMGKLDAEYDLFTLGLNAQIHDFVAISFLPPNLVELQKRNLDELMQQCEWKAHLMRVHTMCLECAMKSVVAELRVAICSFPLNKSHSTTPYEVTCSLHDTKSIVNIDMIGKVLRLGNQRFIWAPCCRKVQPYKGDSDFLWKCSFDGLHNGICNHSHCHQSWKKSSRKNLQCFMCESHTGLTPIHNVLDHHNFKLVDIHACCRHFPTQENMKEATNIDQLCAMVAKKQNRVRSRLSFQ